MEGLLTLRIAPLLEGRLISFLNDDAARKEAPLEALDDKLFPLLSSLSFKKS